MNTTMTSWLNRGIVTGYALALLGGVLVCFYWHAPSGLADTEVMKQMALDETCEQNPLCRLVNTSMHYDPVAGRPVVIATVALRQGRGASEFIREIEERLKVGVEAAPFYVRWMLRDGGTKVSVKYD